jgi:hypothetical protein
MEVLRRKWSNQLGGSEASFGGTDSPSKSTKRVAVLEVMSYTSGGAVQGRSCLR